MVESVLFVKTLAVRVVGNDWEVVDSVDDKVVKIVVVNVVDFAILVELFILVVFACIVTFLMVVFNGLKLELFD